MRYAAVDFGTNTALLLVAERGDDGALTTVLERCEFVQLGAGLDASGVLSDESMARGIAALEGFRRDLDAAGVTAIRAVGTQALREATNAAAFLEPAREALGVPIEVITGDREAELVFTAVVNAFPDRTAGSFVIGDVGGGSTEVIVGAAHAPLWRRSIPIGSRRLTDRFTGSDPPTPSEAAALRAGVHAAFADLSLPANAVMIGTAGTATNIATVALALDSYDAARVQGLAVSRDAVDSQLERLLALDLEARRAVPGMEPRRADVICAGVAIFAGLAARMGATELIVSSRGVRWGVMAELVATATATA
jgi:exopolyphosphatase/guanosine-5'-triphosphate,3'-diphosphate pyrophosphatase